MLQKEKGEEMGKTIDVEEFLSWLNETEEELKGEKSG